MTRYLLIFSVSFILLPIIQVVAAFPDLEHYSKAWPVTDAIMMRLKYTSSGARHREIEMAAGRAMWSKSVPAVSGRLLLCS